MEFLDELETVHFVLMSRTYALRLILFVDIYRVSHLVYLAQKRRRFISLLVMLECERPTYR